MDRTRGGRETRRRGERLLRAKDLPTLAPGRHSDGGGLALIVEPTGARRWSLRVTPKGQPRVNHGLGSFPVVTLEMAREKAIDIRRAAREGRNLPQEQHRQRITGITFAQSFTSYFEIKRPQLGNGKHVAQWTSTMEAYVLPHIGMRPVAEIEAGEIIALLKPIWFAKPETASRVLQRVEARVPSCTVTANWPRPASACAGCSAARPERLSTTLLCLIRMCRPSCHASVRGCKH